MKKRIFRLIVSARSHSFYYTQDRPFDWAQDRLLLSGDGVSESSRLRSSK